MGINLAMAVLTEGADGGRHGGRSEAIDELIRESFWMTEREIARAQSVDDRLLRAAMAEELRRRRSGCSIGERVN